MLQPNLLHLCCLELLHAYAAADAAATTATVTTSSCHP
jgi:hypothetical protein